MTNDISDPSRSFPDRGRASSGFSKVAISSIQIEPLVCTARVHQKLTTLDLAFPPHIYTDLGTSRAP